MPDIDPSDAEYLRDVELLANDVANQALGEGWLSFAPDPDDATPLQRAVNALARRLRHYHFEDDGCTDPDVPQIDLAGALLISPTSLGTEQRYADICARLGVEARTEGWALWHSWDRRGRRITLVTSRISTTEGMLVAWSKGRDVMPSEPPRAALAATVNGWWGPAVRSPGYADKAGLAQRPVAPSLAPLPAGEEGTKRPTLFLTVGLPCAGKTTAARRIEVEREALRLTKDEWVKALYGHENPPAAGDVIEGRLIQIGLRALELGNNVVIDYGLWSRDERSALRRAAADLGATVEMLYFEVTPAEQRARLDQRQAEAPHTTWPMSDGELAEWAAAFEIPTRSELDGSEPIDEPPAGFATWDEWREHRWPPSVS